MNKREYELQTAVCSWLKARHPSIPFRSMPNDVYKDKDHQDGRSHPDTLIMKPAGQWHGLAIEFKKDQATIYRKDGTIRQDRHLLDQLACMRDLLALGYLTAFIWSLDQAIDLITRYLENGDAE